MRETDEEDMAWAIAEARKMQAGPKPQTRPFAEWRAELKAKHADSPTGKGQDPHPSPEQKGSEQ